MTLDEIEKRGRELGLDGVPLGASLRRLADEMDRDLDEFDNHERSAFSDGWLEAVRERVDESDSS